MISIRSSADMTRALASPIDHHLKRLLAVRRDQLMERAYDLSEILHAIVVEPGDTLAAVEQEGAFPLATNPVDGSRFGEPDFVPAFEWVEVHAGGWREAVTILSDDGFALVLFLPDLPGVDPTLLALVTEHA